MKINYGAGEIQLPGFINIDSVKNETSKPNLVCDILQNPLPFSNDSVETIYFLHCIEHIKRNKWYLIFDEFRRVLQMDGELVLAYPEFEVCAKYFIENYKGARDYWRMTLYGRQLYQSDHHIVPMRTAEVIDILVQFGFHDIKYGPEVDEWNTILNCRKGQLQSNREDIYRRELFGLGANK